MGEIPYFFLKIVLKYEMDENPTLPEMDSTESVEYCSKDAACCSRSEFK